MKYLALLFFVFLLSCEGSIFDTADSRLKIKNSSLKAIYFNKQFNFPDTLNLSNPSFLVNVELKLLVDKNKSITFSKTTIEHVFENSIASDTLSIYIYDAEVIENTPWEQIQEEYLVLKRFDLSYQDILDANWLIEFND